MIIPKHRRICAKKFTDFPFLLILDENERDDTAKILLPYFGNDRGSELTLANYGIDMGLSGDRAH